MIILQEDDFSIDEHIKKMKEDSCGATVLFLGTVKTRVKGKDVRLLEMEAYKDMAYKTLKEIEDKAIRSYNLSHVLILHRLGKLEVGENIVLIGTVAEGRDEAFEGARYILEELKEKAPIFKKEYTDNEEYWQG